MSGDKTDIMASSQSMKGVSLGLWFDARGPTLHSLGHSFPTLCYNSVVKLIWEREPFYPRSTASWKSL